jgi:hypothetical protein
MGNDDVARLLGQGRTAIEVLREIAASKREFDASAPALLALNRQASLPPSVVKAMRGEPLSVDEVRQLAAEGTAATEIELLVSLIGMQRSPLSPSQVLDLTKAGLGTELVARIRESALRPPEGSEDKPKGVTTDDFATFEHVTGLFRLHYPRDWFFSRRIMNGSPVYYASPERRVDDPRDAKTIIVLSLSALERPSTATPEQLLNVYSALARQEIPGFEPVNSVQKVQHGAYQEYSANIDETAIRGRTYALIGRDHVNYLSIQAPTADFEGLAPVVEHVAANLDIVAESAPDGIRRNLSSQDVVRRYEEAIVQVRAWDDDEQDFGTGTGFFVRADGYLVTNAHVVLDLKTRKPHKHFEVRWPDRMNRDPERAELVGVQSPLEGRGSAQAGVWATTWPSCASHPPNRSRQFRSCPPRTSRSVTRSSSSDIR